LGCLENVLVRVEEAPRLGYSPNRRELGIKRWLTFLRNHREAIAAMDFFTVPTLTFGVLYCFFVISHDRRKILRFNVTRNPHALWIVQQLREAGPTSNRTDSCYSTETPSLAPM